MDKKGILFGSERHMRDWMNIVYSGNTKKYFATNNEDRVFKEYDGFESKRGYDADISWVNYDNLNLHSKNVHSHINING